jgi:hypothetical protein
MRGLLVARRTLKRFMRARQGKSRHRIVIEAAVFPITAVVALCAIGAIPSLMDIVARVAGDACPGRLPDSVSGAVTCRTARAGMLAEQGKTRVSVVIE